MRTGVTGLRQRLSVGWGEHIPLCAVLAGYVVLTMRYVTYVPTWDGYLYLEAIAHALDSPAKNFHEWFQKFALAGHASYGYAALLVLVSRLCGGALCGVALANMVLGLVGLVSFYVLAGRTLVKTTFGERALMTALLACNPLYLACTVHLNIDFPIIVFLLMFIACIMSGHWLTTILSGVLLIFTKETAVIIYALFVVCFMSLFVIKRIHNCWRSPKKAATRLRLFLRAIEPASWQSLVAMVVPGMIYLLYLAGDGETYGLGVSSGHLTANFGYVQALFMTRLLNVFVLNFSWVFTLTIALAIVRWEVLRHRHSTTRAAIDLTRVCAYVFAMYLAFNLLLTVYHVGVKPRYLLPLTVLLLLFFCGALLYLCQNKYIRQSILVTCCLLCLAQSLWGVDLVSRYCYGTIPFGQQEILRLCSRVNNRYGVQDEYVYNLEHTVIDELLNKAFRRIGVSPDTPIIVQSDWYTIGRLNTHTAKDGTTARVISARRNHCESG